MIQSEGPTLNHNMSNFICMLRKKMELFALLSWNIVFCDRNKLIADRESLLDYQIRYTPFTIKIILIIHQGQNGCYC